MTELNEETIGRIVHELLKHHKKNLPQYIGATFIEDYENLPTLLKEEFSAIGSQLLQVFLSALGSVETSGE